MRKYPQAVTEEAKAHLVKVARSSADYILKEAATEACLRIPCNDVLKGCDECMLSEILPVSSHRLLILAASEARYHES